MFGEDRKTPSALPRTRLILIGLTTTALLLLCLWGYSSLSSVESEIYLIPDGYEGPVLVVYDQPNGQPPEYEGSARLYEVPDTGLLLTRFPPNQSRYRPEFWYVDEDGKRTPIVWGVQCQDALPDDPVVACIMSELAANDESVPVHKGFIITRLSNRKAAAAAFRKLRDAAIVSIQP
jgi:hypothetical protein